jgi:hypothetical protein
MRRWRVTQYNSGLLLREAHPDMRVLTIVFYHCAGTGGIREDEHRLDFYDRTVHQVGYWSVGIGDLEAEAYAATDNPMGWALASWMRQKRAGRVELRLGLMEKILRFVRSVDYRELLLDTLQTYYRLSRSETKLQQQLLRSGRYGEVGEMAQSVFERLESRARREGAAAALRSAALRVIRSRFPEAPESLAGRVERLTNPSALEELVGRAASADRLEEIEPLLPS